MNYGYVGATPRQGPDTGNSGIQSVKDNMDLKLKGRFKSTLGTQANPASSAKAILEANPYATDGNYWIKRPNGDSFEVKCKMEDYGGGWMNITQNWGTVSNALTAATTGNTGNTQQHPFDSNSAARTATQELNTRIAQLRSSGNCQSGAWSIYLSSTMITDFGFTEYRVRYYVNYQNAGCGQLGAANTTNVKLITGPGLYAYAGLSPRSTCNSFGSGGAYAQKVPASSFTFEHYGSLTSTSGNPVVANAQTVCEGDRDMNASVKYIYLR